MKKVDFLIEYEVKPRELDSMCLVAAYLKSKGYSVAFVNSWESLYTKPEPYEAEVAVISACYDDGTYDCFTGLAYSFKKVVNMQWEQVLTNRLYKPHEQEFGDYTGVALSTRHVCWGHKEKKWLEEMYGVPPDMLKVLGYLPLDFYRPEFKACLIPRESLFSKYNLDAKKKTLLFVSSFSLIGLPASEKFDNPNYLDDFTEVSIISQRTILKWFEMLISDYPDIQIVYRAHPTEKDNIFIREMAENNKNFFAISEEPIRHWIAACDKILNWSSTSTVEMYYSGKETLILRPISVPYNYDMCIFEGAKFVCSYEELSAAMNTSYDFPVPPDKLLNWYDMNDTPVYERVGNWLIETYESDGYNSRPSKESVHKHLLLKKIKSKIKYSSLFGAVANVLIKYAGNNVLTQRLEKVIKAIGLEKERLDPNGYAAQKRKQNAASQQEIDEKISEYLKKIK